MTLKQIGSHYHLPTKTVFTLEECEHCGGEAQGANAATVNNLPNLDKSGLTEYKKDWLPAEQYWYDEIDGCACEDCQGK